MNVISRSTEPEEASLGFGGNTEQIPVKSVDSITLEKQKRFEVETKSEAISIIDAIKISVITIIDYTIFTRAHNLC